MEVGYTIIEPGNTLAEQLRLDKFTSYRIAKVSKQLFGIKEVVCDLIPFKGTFPIIKEIASTGFTNSLRAHYMFDELLDSIKDSVYEAERYKYFENSFTAYLKKQNITIDKFKNYHEKHRQLIIDEWQEAERIPDGLLE